MLWVNGERVATGAAPLSPLDRGFTLADGLFVTMLVRHGRIFRAARHLERLRLGASILRIALPVHVERWLHEVVHQATPELRDAAARLTVSRGVGSSGLAPRDLSASTVVITVNEPPTFPSALHEYGLSAITAAARRDERAATAGVKSLAYTEAIVALMRAHDENADEAIFLDIEGHISEASASNVFICRDGTLVTPPLSCGVLPGITREAIIELAPTLGVRVVERPVTARELAEADVAFLTSSLRGVAPLVRIDCRAIGRGTVGAMTRAVSSAYAALVDRECIAAAAAATDDRESERAPGERSR
jgi:branched-chain amino acid aminotransferase